MLKLGYVGVRYQETPLAVRDRVSFTDSKKLDMMQKLQQIGVEQCMVLSTCNRSELFFFCPEPFALADASLCYEGAFPETDVKPYLQRKEGTEAMTYLFRIAAGLESLVLGEDQILGQMVEAMDFSRTMGFAGKELNKVVRDAVTCAKEIKTRFRISEKPLSVSYIGVQQLAKVCPLAGEHILLIGSGKMASLALHHLHEYAPEAVFVCSRSKSHAQKLEELFPEVHMCDYEERYHYMGQCAAVVSATASPHLVIRKGEVEKNRKRMESRREKPGDIFFLDLAAPRDIESEIRELPGVHMIDMDTLQAIGEKNRRERELLAEKSRTVIEEAVAETGEWLRVSRMDDTIESLQVRCQEIAEDSFSYLEHKLLLENREKKLVKKVLNASLQRLIREPIRELKRLDTTEEQDAYKEVVEHLFRIGR